MSISYSGVILDTECRERLITSLGCLVNLYTYDELIAHHMTICLGSLEPYADCYRVGQLVTLLVTHWAANELVLAARVKDNVPIEDVLLKTDGRVPHITIAVNRSIGGVPSMSNQLVDWIALPHSIEVNGEVMEVPFQ